jgi:predicted transposase/invertase (TIGR01784 family)
MTRKPHDALFKAAFEHPEHAAEFLRVVLPAALVDAIAWSTMKRVSGSFIDPHLDDRHSDLLFSVELHDGNTRSRCRSRFPW